MERRWLRAQTLSFVARIYGYTLYSVARASSTEFTGLALRTRRALNLFYNGDSAVHVVVVRRKKERGNVKSERAKERERVSRVGGKQIRRQKKKNRLDSSLLAKSRLSTAISASLVSRPGRFFAFPRMPRTGRAALLTPLSPSPRLIFFYTRGLFSSSVPEFRSSLSSAPHRRQTLCALPGALTTGGCQPFNLA